MILFYKSYHDFYYGSHQNFSIPHLSGDIHLGIDGSTSSFGVAWTDSEFKSKTIMMLIRDDETHSEFFNIVFPLLQTLFKECQILTATYEKTPTDFESSHHALQIMKRTEKSVGLFLSNSFFLNVKHKFNIYDIFPNSWKSFLVQSNIESNYRKTNKRQNAIDILTILGLDVSLWIKEADTISNHSYDGFEALGICSYGAQFINRGVFTAVYRNFKKRRSLRLLYRSTSWDTFSTDVKEFKEQLGSPPVSLMVPNEYHSFMENLYGIDADDRINILIVPPDSPNSLHLYYKLLTGLEGMMMFAVVRNDSVLSQHDYLYI